MRDLLVELPDKPGMLAEMGEVLGNAGVNISGICGIPTGGAGEAHILVDSAQMARDALAQAGIGCGVDRDVELVPIIDQPGELGRHLRKIADAGVNVDLVYLATDTRIVLGSPEMDRLRRALHGG